MSSTGIILTLAYPDTIVMVAEEWYSPLLRFIGIGKKNYIRAGHAALVLIKKDTGILEYHDFGRYITSEPFGRVRGRDTDSELHFPLKAIIENNKVVNIEAILKFLATHPKLTHGEGRLVASVCTSVNYNAAKRFIIHMQNRHFIRYAAFMKEATNCARFVADTLIESVTNTAIKKKLKDSKWFTPSTVGNVLLSNTNKHCFQVSETGEIKVYRGSQRKENLTCFIDRLKDHQPNVIGSLKPKKVEGLSNKAQWLSGIAAGAWFEIFKTDVKNEYRYKRISPYGHVDIDAVFVVNDASFNPNLDYQFVHYSNCKFFNIEQLGKKYHFTLKEALSF